MPFVVLGGVKWVEEPAHFLGRHSTSGIIENHADRAAGAGGADGQIAAGVRCVENKIEKDLDEMVGSDPHRRQGRIHGAVHLHAPYGGGVTGGTYGRGLPSSSARPRDTVPGCVGAGGGDSS